MSALETYELYAIKYAASPDRRRSQCFIYNDVHDGPCPMDFFIWVAVSAKRTVVIDIGGNEENACRRGHTFLRSPADGLKRLGIDAREVQDVVLTHLHWDHAGNIDLFPNARLHLQVKEVAFATGPLMHQRFLRRPFDANDVCAVIRKLYDDMLTYYDGESELAPGIQLRHVGGHTKGQQIVRVHTKRGWVVLASDAAHMYENMMAPNPFPVVVDLPDVLAGFDTMKKWAASRNHIIPGHDPLVIKRYPAVSAALAGEIVRLDMDPNEEA